MMLAIADFADDDGRAFPSISTLATKCRMSPRNTNLILARLRKSGELVVQQNEGPHGTNLYRVAIDPLKPAAPLKNSSPLKDSSRPPEESFPKPLKPASGEPSLNRHEPSARKRAKSDSAKFDPEAHLLDLGIPADLIDDWLALRKQLRAPVTRTAIAGIEREATKASITLADALRICCERSWRGFKASWLQDNRATSQPSDIFAGGL